MTKVYMIYYVLVKPFSLTVKTPNCGSNCSLSGYHVSLNRKAWSSFCLARISGKLSIAGVFWLRGCTRTSKMAFLRVCCTQAVTVINSWVQSVFPSNLTQKTTETRILHWKWPISCWEFCFVFEGRCDEAALWLSWLVRCIKATAAMGLLTVRGSWYPGGLAIFTTLRGKTCLHCFLSKEQQCSTSNITSQWTPSRLSDVTVNFLLEKQKSAKWWVS